MKLGQTVASSADVTRDYHDPRSSGRARQACYRGGVSMTIRRACCARHCLTARCTVRSRLSVNRSGCIDLIRARWTIAGKPGSSDNQAPICSRRSSSIEVRSAISTCSSRNCAPTTAPRNLRPRHFQCDGAARTPGAESTNRRNHPNRSQQGCAVPRRQGRQRCPQSAESEGGFPEEDSTYKEIRGAEVNLLSMCGRDGPRQVLGHALLHASAAGRSQPRLCQVYVLRHQEGYIPDRDLRLSEGPFGPISRCVVV